MLHGHLITPWLVAQGMVQCWHVPPCSRESCVVVVGGKTFPRGSFPATGSGSPVGSQVPKQELWAQSLAGCMVRLCVCSPWWPWLALW